jgi:hypothetical protein
MGPATWFKKDTDQQGAAVMDGLGLMSAKKQ